MGNQEIKKMNFLRKKKNEQKDAEPEQDYGIRFNTNLDKRFLSSGRYRGRLESILNRQSEMPGQLMIDDLR